MKISKIVCPKCEGTEFNPGLLTYECGDCGYALTDEDRENILQSMYDEYLAEQRSEGDE